jgi:hypothetical protein
MYDGVLKIRQGIDLILFKPDVKHIPFSTHIEIYSSDVSPSLARRGRDPIR